MSYSNPVQQSERTCPICKAVIEADLLFCPRCGTRVYVTQSQNLKTNHEPEVKLNTRATPQVPDLLLKNEDTPSASTFQKISIIILAIVIVILSIIAFRNISLY